MTHPEPTDLITAASTTTGTRLDPGTLDELFARADEQARADVASTVPPNTHRARLDDWKTWCAFLEPHGVAPERASVALFVAFIRHLAARGDAVSTIERRVSGVTTTLLRDHGLELSVADRKVVRDALNALARTASIERSNRGRGQSAPLLADQLRTIVERLPTDTLPGLRDRALLLVGFSVGGRRGQIANLNVEDFTMTAEGMRVHLVHQKGKARTTAVPYRADTVVCPVRAFLAWLDATNRTISSTGPAWLPLSRYGTIRRGRLTGESVGLIVARRAREAGFTQWFTGHSFRSGFATESRRNGASREDIEMHGGWAPGSRALGAYLRRVDEFTDNVLNLIEL